MSPEALTAEALGLIRVKLSSQEAMEALSGIYGRRVNHEDIAALLSADSNTPPPWLPGITFLDNEILPVAAGYASSTNAIYINQNAWASLNDIDRLNILIEELGHAIETHLFNGIDTPGDEGQLFRQWITQESSTTSNRADTGAINNNTQTPTDSSQPEGATDVQAAIDPSSEIHPLSAPADDSRLIVVDGAPIAIETAGLNSFNWSRSRDFSKAINLNFNELVGLPSAGLQIPPGQTRREIFNIDDIIGTGYKDLPVLGFAGLSADIDAAIGYDFGMKLDLGEANARISGGADIKIGGFLPEPGSELQGNLDFDLDIKPIILDWGLTTPSFKAWAYLFYEAGLNLDWYYDLPVPGWAKEALSWLGIPASDRGHILEPDSFRIADTIGKEIGFNAESFGGKIDLTSGLNLGGSISTSSPAKPSPAWASTIFPNIDLRLFSPPLPKPKVSQNSIQLSSEFPVLELTAELDKALAQLTGIPFSGDFGFDFGPVSFFADWNILGIDPTLQLNGYYDLKLDFGLPSEILVYDIENPGAKSLITKLSGEQFQAGASAISDYLLNTSTPPADLNKNGQFDIAFEWSPSAFLNVDTGYRVSAFIDYEILKATVGVGVDIDSWFGDYSKQWELTLGPVLSDRIPILGGPKTSVFKDSLNVTPSFLRNISVPISIPRAITDPTIYDIALSLGLTSGNSLQPGQTLAVPGSANTVILPEQYFTQIEIDGNSANEITIKTNPFVTIEGTQEIGLKLPTPAASTNTRFIVNERFLGDANKSTETLRIDSIANQSSTIVEKIINFDEGVGRDAVSASSFRDQEGHHTSIRSHGSFIGDLGDGNDSYLGQIAGSLIAFGEGDDEAIVGTNLETFSQPNFSVLNGEVLREEREKIRIKHLQNSFFINSWYTETYPYFYSVLRAVPAIFDFGRGSDYLVITTNPSKHEAIFDEYPFELGFSGEFIFDLDQGSDIVDLREVYDSISFYDASGVDANLVALIHLMGTEESRRQIDTISFNYSPSSFTHSAYLHELHVNQGAPARSASILFPGLLSENPSYVAFGEGEDFQILLDYSQVSPAEIDSTLQGVTVEIGSIGQDFDFNPYDYQQSTGHLLNSLDVLGDNEGAFASRPQSMLLYDSSEKQAVRSLSVIGSQLDDIFNINQFTLGIEGLGGDDTYHINAPFVPANTRFQAFSKTTLGRSPYLAYTEQPRSTFLYDSQGHSTVSIGDHALESFYAHAPNIINIDLLSAIGSRIPEFLPSTFGGPVGVIPTDFDDTDLPSWSLDFSSLSEFLNTDNVGIQAESRKIRSVFDFMYSDPINYTGKIYTETPREIIFGASGSRFDPRRIWGEVNAAMPANGMIYDPINQYLPNFGLKYTLGSGHDEVYGYTPNDVFDVSLGSKIIIDDSSSDSDTLILRRPISEITLETIDAEANHYRIRNRLSPDEGTIEITNIENIAIQYGDLSPTYFTYDVSSLFASPPLLIRGLPEDRVGDWLAGSESQPDLLSVYLTILTNQINSGATSFGLSSDGSIRIPERIFTSRITTLDNTPVQLTINSQETSSGQVSIERSNSVVIIRKEGGFSSQPQELVDINFALRVGAREFASKLHINAYEAAGGSPIAIADNNGSIKDENGEELLKATVGNGATLVAGSLIKIADSDGDGKVRGSDITVDLNGDDIPDLLPSSDILASGIIDLSVVTQASADPLAATVVDVDLANPVIANRYRKFFNNQWNDFVYDPLRPELGGAELLDANGDGLIEKVRLHLFDGGAGDNDGVVNGVIVDPGLLVIDETSQPIPPEPEPEPEPEPASLAVHRLFNPDSSRHLFSAVDFEIDLLTGEYGWIDEGIAFLSPTNGTTNVYRFFVQNEGRHFYTANDSERDLIRANPAMSDWQYEGIAYQGYSVINAPDDAIPVIRYFNESIGSHVYSTSSEEQMILDQRPDWTREGLAWFSAAQ